MRRKGGHGTSSLADIKGNCYFGLQVEIEKTQLLKVVAVKTEDEQSLQKA